jgi:hypothetical protein
VGPGTSYELFLASARELGAAIGSEGIRFDRDGRSVSAVWSPPGKSTPPRIRFTTVAGPLAQPPALERAAATVGGPFRREARARIESPAPLTLRLETRLDRTGKSLRLNRETQTGDADFDERVYLESEAPDAVVLAVLVDPIMRAGVIKCLTLGCTSLTLDNEGNLRAELPLTIKGEIAPSLLARVLDTLGATAEAIPPLQGKGHHRSVPGLVPVIAVAFAILSWPLFYLVDWLWEPIGSDLYVTAALGGLALWVVNLPIFYFILRGRSISLRDLLTTGIALAIGFPLGGADLLLTLNGLLDTSAPMVHQTEVKSLRRTTGKNASSHVTLTSWRRGEETIEIEIGSSLYSTLSRGQALRVTTRRGSLGWERMTELSPATAPRTSG